MHEWICYASLCLPFQICSNKFEYKPHALFFRRFRKQTRNFPGETRRIFCRIEKHPGLTALPLMVLTYMGNTVKNQRTTITIALTLLPNKVPNAYYYSLVNSFMVACRDWLSSTHTYKQRTLVTMCMWLIKNGSLDWDDFLQVYYYQLRSSSPSYGNKMGNHDITISVSYNLHVYVCMFNVQRKHKRRKREMCIVLWFTSKKEMESFKDWLFHTSRHSTFMTGS